MIKRFLKKRLTRLIINIVISVLLIWLSLLGASRLEFNTDTDILTGIVSFVYMLLFFSSLFFLCIMTYELKKEIHDIKEKKKK